MTIEVPDAKIGKLLSQLEGYKALCEHVPVEEPPKKTNGRGGRMHSRADSLLTMTGKEPNEKSQLWKARYVFEKLEKKKGIGTVTVEAFRKELVSKKLPKQLAQRCVTENVLAYLE
ncbi:MAG: hypothetical protein AMJ72_05380 [Acidithiobacillales bacterium SM1_46]|nr:MAG: hypothetical protein AMJ72_05380 [Acidithiobacillales bacterium SM1_46]